MLKTIVAFALTACATGGVASTPASLDQSRMTQVEHQARLVGVQVVWINPPIKR